MVYLSRQLLGYLTFNKEQDSVTGEGARTSDGGCVSPDRVAWWKWLTTVWNGKCNYFV